LRVRLIDMFSVKTISSEQPIFCYKPENLTRQTIEVVVGAMDSVFYYLTLPTYQLRAYTQLT